MLVVEKKMKEKKEEQIHTMKGDEKWKPKDWLCPQITLICMRESESVEERKSLREKSDLWKKQREKKETGSGFYNNS